MTAELAEGRARFEELAADPWRAFLRMAEGATNAPDDTLAALTLKREVEDLLIRYTNRYDAKDLPGILDCFSEDALLISPAGRLDGAAALQTFYSPSVLLERFVLHRLLETTVQVAPDGRSAWVASYFSSYSHQTLQNAWSQNGRYFGRAMKQGDAWRFSELSIVIDYTKTYVATPVQN